jgi:hypothetical protein
VAEAAASRRPRSALLGAQTVGLGVPPTQSTCQSAPSWRSFYEYPVGAASMSIQSAQLLCRTCSRCARRIRTVCGAAHVPTVHAPCQCRRAVPVPARRASRRPAPLRAGRTVSAAGQRRCHGMSRLDRADPGPDHSPGRRLGQLADGRSEAVRRSEPRQRPLAWLRQKATSKARCTGRLEPSPTRYGSG